ncbi:MAG: type II secretion system protein GspG [Candidatus Staskawiczbacteria bacterium]|nr:type II secretion system protein GspG [Candidatus Staskawiczbacteria bacterium]
MYQFRTALDLYYLDHNNYPEVSNGSALLDVLKNENYIRENSPLNPDNFNYQVKDSGQDYSLKIN